MYPIPGGRGYLTGLGPVNVGGNLTMNGDIIMQSGRVIALDPSTSATNCALQWRGDASTGIVYGGAGTTNVSATAGLSFSVNSLGPIALKPIYVPESGAAPSAIANYSIIYSLDVAAKTQLNAKEGANGTTTQLAIEV